MARKENLEQFVEQKFSQPRQVNGGAKSGKAIVHTHTTFSDGNGTPEDHLNFCVENDIQVMAITDHDVIEGALKALQEAKQRDLSVSVVVGEEISTAQGHCGGLFLQEAIKMGSSLLETAREIHRQDGLVVIPHLGFGPSPISISPKTVRRLYEQGEWVDAIEVVCPNFSLRHIQEALGLCEEYQIAQLGANDCHFIKDLKRGFLTFFEGETAEDLRKSIRQRKTLAVRGESLSNVSLKENIIRHYRGLTWGLPVKIASSPIFISTFFALRRAQVLNLFEKISKY